MLKTTALFSGFSVQDITKAKSFYLDKLGLEVEQTETGLQIHFPNGATVFVYEKPNHEPATFTVLNLVVENIDTAAEALSQAGIELIQYNSPDIPQDEKGILRGLAAKMGPDIAWFTDPSGNIFSILQEK